MSFVFRGSRGDIESAFSGFIPERRAVRIHGGSRTINANPMAFLAMVFLLFMFLNSRQMSPNFLLWLGLALFLMATSLRMYAMCQHLQAQAQAHAAAVAAAAGGLVGHTELRLRMPPSIAFATRGRLQGLRLQLALLDRDFDDLDYDALRALDSDNPPGVRSMSDTEINALPVYKYKSQSQQPTSECHSEGTSKQSQISSCSMPHEMPVKKSDQVEEGRKKERDEELTCSVCLEQVNDGELVRSLPCLHRFHVPCIDPWLRQQATCPVCKFRVGSGWQDISEPNTGPYLV